ncbi:MAG: hypothetical protein ACOZDY_06520 [Pseudomonadota bacterium]
MMVRSLDVREKIVPIVHDLGHHQALYGVRAEDVTDRVPSRCDASGSKRSASLRSKAI